MSDVLAKICADKRAHVAASKAKRSLAEVRDALARASPPRGFYQALQRDATDKGFGLICEIKKASPSKGLIRTDFDPPLLAQAYAAGGATCLSVLTDQPYFQGEDDFLRSARAAVELPCLRKDFMLDPYQIYESRALGADCVLLIMAALEDNAAQDLEALAQELGMDVLIEVHNRAELDRALALRSSLLGINNRNLKTLVVDLAVTEELAKAVPKDRFLIGESGIHGPADIARLRAVGSQAFLIGESLMRQENVTAATQALRAA